MRTYLYLVLVVNDGISCLYMIALLVTLIWTWNACRFLSISMPLTIGNKIHLGMMEAYLVHLDID